MTFKMLNTFANLKEGQTIYTVCDINKIPPGAGGLRQNQFQVLRIANIKKNNPFQGQIKGTIESSSGYDSIEVSLTESDPMFLDEMTAEAYAISLSKKSESEEVANDFTNIFGDKKNFNQEDLEKLLGDGLAGILNILGSTKK